MKNNRVLYVLLIIIGILLIISFGRGGGGQESAPATASWDVVYTITGSAGARLTYNNESDNTEQLDVADLPWSLSLEVEPGQFLYVSAQTDERNGRIECEITVNGEVVETAVSEGDFVIATCSQ